MPQHHRLQDGVAIITALLIMTIVATVGITLATHLQLDVRRTSNIIANEQALIFVSGAEELSRYGLQLDRENNSIDDYKEEWAKPQTFPFEGGSLKGQLSDLQACFNINSLVAGNAVNPLAKERFQRLLSTLTLNPSLADAVIDWIDSNVDTSLPDGAEDGYYMNLEKPYRTANQAMQSPSELRLVKGFEATEAYNILAPFVCAFGQSAGINVNTAREEVLISLARDMTPALAKQIIAERTDKAYDSVNDMITRNSLSKVITSIDQLSVATDYFLLTTEVAVAQSRVQVYSVLWRQASGKTSVLMHSIGAY
jgi:general secretion pathway protein K